MGRPSSWTQEKLTELWNLYAVERLSVAKCAERFGVSAGAVNRGLKLIKDSSPEEDLTEMRQMSMALHRDLIQRAYDLLRLVPPPVTAGKDGRVIKDPITNEVVRDYGPHLAAMAMALKVDESSRKLLGLDSATKVDVLGTVKYEIVGVNPEDLT